MGFTTQFNKTVSSCFYTQEISKIKSFLSREQLNIVITALVTSKLDYCNSLLYKIKNSEIEKLQSVQNVAIRLLFNRCKFDRLPLAPLYNEIHWLKVRKRIYFKICLIVHHCIWGAAPELLKRMMLITNPRTFKLKEKRCIGQYGERAISQSGPKLWNSLPLEVRMESKADRFKIKLKPFLMKTN